MKMKFIRKFILKNHNFFSTTSVRVAQPAIEDGKPRKQNEAVTHGFNMELA
jgi:hypothetical protein